MDGESSDGAQSTPEKQSESEKTEGKPDPPDELDSLLDSAIDDFDKYQSSNVDTGKHEDAASNDREAMAPMETRPFQPELPPLPPDQEAFFNAIFNNPEAQQMFSGMNEAFAGLMSGFEQMSQDPELKNEMESMMQSTFAMMGAGAPPSGDPSSTDSTRSTHAPSGTSESELNEGEDLAKTLGETLQKLAESAKDVKDGNIPQEEMMKAFENLNMEGGEEVLLPMVQNMMENLLSKDVLYPSLKEVTDKYPQWLEENKSKLAESDYERYCKQQGTMYKVCKQYEEEDESDPPEVKKERIMKIMNLIQEMESYGEPPKEIVGDMPSTGLQFDEKGLPKIPGMPPGEQCSVM